MIVFSGGGVFKRIDENRELLEVLQQKAPEFLQKNPWVYLWIEAHDEFFTELAKAADMEPLPGHEPMLYADHTSVTALCMEQKKA